MVVFEAAVANGPGALGREAEEAESGRRQEPVHTSHRMRLSDLYRWLPFQSKATRDKRDRSRALEGVLEQQRQRQAHYRLVTGSGLSGQDRRDGR